MNPRRRPLDYKLIRQAVTPRQVLEQLGWRPVTICGSRSRGPCPIHVSSGTGSRILSCTSTVAYCHRCKWTGDAVAIWARLKGLPTLEAAYEVCSVFGIPTPFLPL